MSKIIKLKDNTYIANRYFSTKERVVGTWIDGKTLYSKTITTVALMSASKTIPHNISNVDKIWIDTSNSFYCADHMSFQLPSISYWGNISIKVDVMVTETNVQLYTNDPTWGERWTFYVTILYTKTTD